MGYSINPPNNIPQFIFLAEKSPIEILTHWSIHFQEKLSG